MTVQSGNQFEATEEDSDAIVFKLSWVGYIAIIPTVIIVAIIMFGAQYLLNDHIYRIYIFAIYFSGLSFITYKLFLLNSVRLIINKNGVWSAKGILPWDKTCDGMQWRNIGIASYNNNLFTWLFKAYSINLEDRYTSKIELTVNNIAEGKSAVVEINRILAEKT